MMLRRGVLSSPDMLTPARMPVTAGKKIAKVSQKPTFPMLLSHATSPGFCDGPAKNDAMETTIAANTKYCTRNASWALFIEIAVNTAQVTTPISRPEWLGK